MKKSRLITLLLLTIVIILMGAIFYIASLLTNNSSQSPAIGQIRTKAQSKTYQRMIALNTVTVTLVPSLTESPTPTEELTPSPTEIILVYNNPSSADTNGSSGAMTVDSSITPTQITNLPATGYVTNALIIFATASVLIFFSFIF